MDQFLFMTGSTEAEVVAAQVANWNFPQWPELEDFGDVLLRGNGGSGYARVDWYTPGRPRARGATAASSSWARRATSSCGSTWTSPGGRARSHLFLVDGKAARHVDASGGDLPYGRQLLADIVDRTETAMSQAHCFLACQLALEAQAKAVRLDARAGVPPGRAPSRRPATPPALTRWAGR